MSKLAAAGPNADQIEFWNGEGGEKFVRYQNALDLMLKPFGDEAIRRAGVKSGEAVLDIGCGCGDTSIDLAMAVGVTGEVVGVDISEPMLARAEYMAAQSELTNVFFEQADVEAGPMHADSFDLAFSRFGVMFFRHPVTAFSNVHTALRKGGRLAFACWQALPRNQWVSIQMQAVLPLVPPPPPMGPEDPGPFSFADQERVRGILSAAGFTDIAVEPFDTEVVLGGMQVLDDAVDFSMELGPAASLLKDAPSDVRDQARATVRAALESHQTKRGVMLAAGAWIVTATKK
ncbi:methyltransferase domain-containing protein [Emcibacter sp. SYSU 3D8]|uniref:class I SAM-dependent methyltransferase n=1 Tax=Emcibacter sp. SYSU 3D8 TaxID=3133969 RepID=UPI0031FF31AF